MSNLGIEVYLQQNPNHSFEACYTGMQEHFYSGLEFYGGKYHSAGSRRSLSSLFATSSQSSLDKNS